MVKTLQELQMLSSVTLNRQIVKMIVLNPESQLSKLHSVYQTLQVSRVIL